MKGNVFILTLLLIAGCSGKLENNPSVATIGQQAPSIELKTLINSDVKEIVGWKDLKDKAVLLEFWSTSCEPCIDNIPHLNRLVEKFQGQPVVFISITDESEFRVREFMKEHEMKGWIAVAAPRSIFKDFRAFGRPHTVLVYQNSKVAAFIPLSSIREDTIKALIEGKTIVYKEETDAPVKNSTTTAKR